MVGLGGIEQDFAWMDGRNVNSSDHGKIIALERRSRQLWQLFIAIG
jgi:hypothetical protein